MSSGQVGDEVKGEKDKQVVGGHPRPRKGPGGHSRNSRSHSPPPNSMRREFIRSHGAAVLVLIESGWVSTLARQIAKQRKCYHTDPRLALATSTKMVEDYWFTSIVAMHEYPGIGHPRVSLLGFTKQNRYNIRNTNSRV